MCCVCVVCVLKLLYFMWGMHLMQIVFPLYINIIVDCKLNIMYDDSCMAYGKLKGIANQILNMHIIGTVGFTYM